VKTSIRALIAVAVLGLVGLAAWLWRQQLAVGPSAAFRPAEVAPAPSRPPPLASAEPSVKYPIEPAVPDAAQGAPDLQASLIELLGRQAVLSMLQLQDFPRRFVATVDNLGRSHAPASLWPVNPLGGRIVVEQVDGAPRIGADNALRYTPYVLLLERIDMRRAAALYGRFYPQLQRAYEELGFPRRHFNDRLVEVIDQLLATPELDRPIALRLPEIIGPIAPPRPWVMYEFEDPALQALSAGQRTLLRMGAVNQRRVKARLTELRSLVTAGALPR
jgi:Protein of unknown function (DUF3014)